MLTQTQQQFDVIVYGATVAGVAAAMTYAQNGVRVALVEPVDARGEYDRLDYMSPAADQLLRGLLRREMPQTAPGKVECWTRWGWIRSDGASNQGTFVNANELRTILLSSAHHTRGVTLFRRATAEQIIQQGDQITGLQIQQPDSGQPLQLLARLTIAADGPDSRLAQFAGVKRSQSDRVYYHAFYELSGPPRAQIWLLDPDVAAIVSHGNSLTEVIYAPADPVAFQPDVEGSFTRSLSQLHDALHVPDSTRISPVIGPIVTASAHIDSKPGLTFIGAAQLSMPLFRANQMGIDLESAFSLVENTLQALMVTGEQGSAVNNYQQQQRQATRAYRQHSDEFVSGRRFNYSEKLVLAAAAHHPAGAARFFAYLNQSITRNQLLKPDTVIQALRSNRKPIPAKPLSAPQSS